MVKSSQQCEGCLQRAERVVLLGYRKLRKRAVGNLRDYRSAGSRITATSPGSETIPASHADTGRCLVEARRKENSKILWLSEIPHDRGHDRAVPVLDLLTQSWNLRSRHTISLTPCQLSHTGACKPRTLQSSYLLRKYLAFHQSSSVLWVQSPLKPWCQKGETTGSGRAYWVQGWIMAWANRAWAPGPRGEKQITWQTGECILNKYEIMNYMYYYYYYYY